MDTQLKRGLLDVCVLAAIQEEESYGYQIIKKMNPYVSISESTLYPILRRLETSGLLTVRSAEHGGRLRKYYRITPAGRPAHHGFCRRLARDIIHVPIYCGERKLGMNKEQFLQAVRRRLAGLPDKDVEGALAYYREMIEDRMEDGLSEEEAVAALGSAEDIAAQILMELPAAHAGKGAERACPDAACLGNHPFGLGISRVGQPAVGGTKRVPGRIRGCMGGDRIPFPCRAVSGAGSAGRRSGIGAVLRPGMGVAGRSVRQRRANLWRHRHSVVFCC